MNRVKKPRMARSIPGNPEWEAVKAARSSIDHNDAAQEVATLQRQYYDLWGHKVATSPVNLNAVLRTLIVKKIPFVLTGTHGISGWTGRPRATKDVDILVKGGRNHARAVKALQALYPQLEVKRFAGLVAFFIPGEKQSVIDVVYPHRADIEETLANPVWTEDKEQGLRYRIPTLEAALANKYGAMITPVRDLGKRLLDAADFTGMVLHSLDEGQQPIDLQNLETLGEKARPGGGGKEILQLVEQVKAGKPININEMGGIAKR
jgi:hypothetical protein